MPKRRDSRFIQVLVIEFNGQQYASSDEMPAQVRAAYERVVHDAPVLHSGARLAAKLKATIIVDDAQFSHAGEMAVDDRHQYHEALEALFTPDIAMSVAAVDEAEQPRASKVWLIVLVVSVLAAAVYFWLRTFTG